MSYTMDNTIAACPVYKIKKGRKNYIISTRKVQKEPEIDESYYYGCPHLVLEDHKESYFGITRTCDCSAGYYDAVSKQAITHPVPIETDLFQITRETKTKVYLDNRDFWSLDAAMAAIEVL